jgi:hypothetical protein
MPFGMIKVGSRYKYISADSSAKVMVGARLSMQTSRGLCMYDVKWRDLNLDTVVCSSFGQEGALFVRGNSHAKNKKQKQTRWGTKKGESECRQKLQVEIRPKLTEAKLAFASKAHRAYNRKLHMKIVVRVEISGKSGTCSFLRGFAPLRTQLWWPAIWIGKAKKERTGKGGRSAGTEAD